MDPAFWKSLQNLSLGSEKAPLQIDEAVRKARAEENRRSLVVKPLNPSYQKTAQIKAALPKAWGLEDRVRCIPKQDGTYQFFFEAEHNMLTVLEEGPWHCNNWMVAIDKWSRRGEPDFLSKITFKVQVLHVPEEFRTPDMIRAAAKDLGVLGQIKIVEPAPGKEGEVWIYVTKNVTDQLQFVSYVQFDPNRDPIMIRFIYEKLRKFCFRCGALTHSDAACDYEGFVYHQGQI